MEIKKYHIYNAEVAGREIGHLLLKEYEGKDVRIVIEEVKN